MILTTTSVGFAHYTSKFETGQHYNGQHKNVMFPCSYVDGSLKRPSCPAILEIVGQ